MVGTNMNDLLNNTKFILKLQYYDRIDPVHVTSKSGIEWNYLSGKSVEERCGMHNLCRIAF